jgi:predicted Zn-dependent protease
MMKRPRRDFNLDCQLPYAAKTSEPSSIQPMSGQLLTNLLNMLASGRDNALLRFSLGSEFLKAGDNAAAVEHLRAAVRQDPAYSAAWKLLGRALDQIGQAQDALAAYRQGISVAENKGDKQAAREMTVFARRVEKTLQAKPD